MKERTFYTVNLDTRRIVILLIIFGAVLAYSYMLGYSLGKKRGFREANPDTMVSNESTPNSSNSKAAVKKIKPVIESEEELSQHADESLMKSEIVNLNPPKKEEGGSIEETKKTEKLTKEEKPEKPVKRKKMATKKTEIEEAGPFYTVQLGAFSSQDQAGKFREDLLASQKVSGKLTPYVYKNGELYVVRMGRANNKKELDKIISKLDPKTQQSAIIVRQNR